MRQETLEMAQHDYLCHEHSYREPCPACELEARYEDHIRGQREDARIRKAFDEMMGNPLDSFPTAPINNPSLEQK